MDLPAGRRGRLRSCPGCYPAGRAHNVGFATPRPVPAAVHRLRSDDLATRSGGRVLCTVDPAEAATDRDTVRERYRGTHRFGNRRPQPVAVAHETPGAYGRNSRSAAGGASRATR
ncbi:hypothetical protein GCM10027570_00080 [Streptomonospora sediminis]